jgi:hypothetical protein
MSAETLLRDPGFQLNLLLWMTREQPKNAYLVRPLFHELGFALVYIENPFPLPEETIRAVEASGLDICVSPEPDVLLGRETDKKGLYIEAKSDSFSPASSNARQARGHLLAAGPAFAEVMKPLVGCLLCYVVPDPDRPQMDTCLANLADGLRRSRLISGQHSVHGLRLNGTDVLYTWDARFSAHTGISGDSAVVLRNVTDDTDPSPLFLVFCDQDYPDTQRQDLNRRAFQNQVYAVLLCDLNLTPAGGLYARTIDDLLHKTTDGVFQYIGRERQKRMRRLIRENLFKRIFTWWHDKAPGLVRLDDDTLKIQFRDATQQATFLDWLEDYKRADFSTATPPPEEPLPLLRMMETQQERISPRNDGEVPL